VRARDWAGGYELSSTPITRDSLASFDCVVVLTEHRAVDYRLVASAAPLIVDTRNAIGHGAGPHVFRLGAPQPKETATATAIA
jgi:UDP-N-acetyl-D-mannosaminuronate dehydrogenase